MKCVAKAKSPVKLKSDSSAILGIFFFKNSDEICNQNQNTLFIHFHVN